MQCMVFLLSVVHQACLILSYMYKPTLPLWVLQHGLRHSHTMLSSMIHLIFFTYVLVHILSVSQRYCSAHPLQHWCYTTNYHSHALAQINYHSYHTTWDLSPHCSTLTADLLLHAYHHQVYNLGILSVAAIYPSLPHDTAVSTHYVSVKYPFSPSFPPLSSQYVTSSHLLISPRLSQTPHHKAFQPSHMFCHDTLPYKKVGRTTTLNILSLVLVFVVR